MTKGENMVERLSMPVIERYVRQLLHDSDRQYRAWIAANAPDNLRTALSQPNEEGEGK
jgi:hypothetical protein